MVEVITQWPGRATEEVERLITVPVEIGMYGIPQLRVVRSISLYGLSDVIMTFQDGVDPYFAREQAFQRLGDITLPTGVTPSIAPLSSPSGLVYRYVLQSPDRSPMDLKTIDDWDISKVYRAVPGVADLSALGGPTMQYQVLIDPIKLAGAGLTVPMVSAALGANNDNAGGGFYSEGGQFYYVRGLGRVATPQDIANIVVAVKNGTPVLVKDIGEVVIGQAPRLGQFGYDSANDAVEGVILMRTGEQAQTVLKRVEAATDLLNHTLPKDVRVEAFYDRSDLIHLTTRTVADNLLRGIVLVVVVLVFFLYDVRSGLDRRGNDSVVPAVRVHLPRSSTHPGKSAVDWRNRFRHSGRRIRRDGGEHPSTIGESPWDHVLHPRRDRGGGGPGRSSDRLRGRRHRDGLLADLRAVGSIRAASSRRWPIR